MTRQRDRLLTAPARLVVAATDDVILGAANMYASPRPFRQPDGRQAGMGQSRTISHMFDPNLAGRLTGRKTR
jgi:hypothetical protein